MPMVSKMPTRVTETGLQCDSSCSLALEEVTAVVMEIQSHPREMVVVAAFSNNRKSQVHPILLTGRLHLPRTRTGEY